MPFSNLSLNAAIRDLQKLSQLTNGMLNVNVEACSNVSPNEPMFRHIQYVLVCTYHQAIENRGDSNYDFQRESEKLVFNVSEAISLLLKWRKRFEIVEIYHEDGWSFEIYVYRK